MKNSKNYHSHHDNLPFQIYLKDHTFIPDFIYLPISNPYLQLYNSDDDENSKYTIQCYGVKEYHNMIILSNQSIIISFISLGKFELTCLENALMKVSNSFIKLFINSIMNILVYC